MYSRKVERSYIKEVVVKAMDNVYKEQPWEGYYFIRGNEIENLLIFFKLNRIGVLFIHCNAGGKLACGLPQLASVLMFFRKRSATVGFNQDDAEKYSGLNILKLK